MMILIPKGPMYVNVLTVMKAMDVVYMAVKISTNGKLKNPRLENDFILVKCLKMYAIHMPHAKTLMAVILVNALMDFMQVVRLVSI